MDTFILGSVKGMVVSVADYLPTFFTIMAILILGWVTARVISKLIARVFKEIYFNTICQHLGLVGILRKGGIKSTPSDVVGCLVYWIIMITVLATSIKVFGLPMVDDLVNRLFSYVPSVISAVFVLIFGMILGNFIASLVRVVASNTDIPRPDILGMLTKYAIVVFAITIFLREIGLGDLISGDNLNALFMSICLALALAFGLGGRDMAAKYIDKLNK